MGRGSLTVSGGGYATAAVNTYVSKSGPDGAGTLNVLSGGTLSDVEGYVGGYVSNYYSTITAAATVDGAGSKWINSGSFYVGYNCTGTLDVTGGGAVTAGSATYIGYDSSGTGTLTVGSGSTWTNTNGLYVGYNGSGTLNLSGGTVVSSTIAGYAGTTTVNFQGGTLKANAANANWINGGSGTGNVYVRAGGGTFDTQTYNMGIACPCCTAAASPTAASTKVGAGTLTLSGANTYTGATTVGAGVLDG